MDIINFYKKAGETPKEALERLRRILPEYEKVKLTYAGRLDPLAEGVLPVLAGNIKQMEKDKILNLPKTYYFEILWGIRTDSFDILGMPEEVGYGEFNEDKIAEILLETKETKEMKYPPYSSKTVFGRPLFEWAREGRIGEIKIPKRAIKIFSVENIQNFNISKDGLLRYVLGKVSAVKGDFRQEEIKSAWQNLIENSKTNIFAVSSFRAEVSSGTYIRRLAEIMGQKMHSGALCLKIIREKVGDYEINR